MAWEEVDYDLAKNPRHNEAVLTIIHYTKKGRPAFNGSLSSKAIELLNNTERVRIFIDKSRKLIALESSESGFKITKTAQPQHLLPLTSVMKELGENDVVGSYAGKMKNKKIIFDLNKKLPAIRGR